MNELYVKSLLTTKIFIPSNCIGKNIQDLIKEKLNEKIANKCISEGYVSPNNIKIISTSAGVLYPYTIVYEVLYECMICHPIEGMQFVANVKTITGAGIHARIIDDDGNIPITVFISRDHNNLNENFHNVCDQDFVVVKIIGIRYEINDATICALSTYVSMYDERKGKGKGKGKGTGKGKGKGRGSKNKSKGGSAKEGEKDAS